MAESVGHSGEVIADDAVWAEVVDAVGESLGQVCGVGEVVFEESDDHLGCGGVCATDGFMSVDVFEKQLLELS